MSQNWAQRHVMQENWRAALASGLSNIRSSRAQQLTVEMAFYGHEYNDGKPGSPPEYTAIDIAPGLEAELLVLFGDSLAETAPETVPTKLYLPDVVQKALAAIQRSQLFDGRDSLVISFVKQVNRYLVDREFRALVHREVSAAMELEPAVIIGHSLGSVVAYQWLREFKPSRQPALITLGSPLGLAPVQRRIDPRFGPAGWPGQAKSWTNIAARQDAVAIVKKLAPLYSPDIRDVPCDNPRRAAHSATSYLANVRVARAVEAALA